MAVQLKRLRGSEVGWHWEQMVEQLIAGLRLWYPKSFQLLCLCLEACLDYHASWLRRVSCLYRCRSCVLFLNPKHCPCSKSPTKMKWTSPDQYMWGRHAVFLAVPIIHSSTVYIVPKYRMLERYHITDRAWGLLGYCTDGQECIAVGKSFKGWLGQELIQNLILHWQASEINVGASIHDLPGHGLSLQF